MAGCDGRDVVKDYRRDTSGWSLPEADIDT